MFDRKQNVLILTIKKNYPPALLMAKALVKSAQIVNIIDNFSTQFLFNKVIL